MYFIYFLSFSFFFLVKEKKILNFDFNFDFDLILNDYRQHKFIFMSGDFISFKLDIDHPDTEIPIALALLDDSHLPSLINEFFFELHFRSGIL